MDYVVFMNKHMNADQIDAKERSDEDEIIQTQEKGVYPSRSHGRSCHHRFSSRSELLRLHQ